VKVFGFADGFMMMGVAFLLEPGGAVVDRQTVADQDTAEVFSENVAQEVTSAALSFFELIQFSIDSVASKLLSQC
jgi:hypothetical protein